MVEYSVVADLLNKFHTSPEWIQALWIVAVPASLWVVSWGLRELLALLLKRPHPPGELMYSVYHNSDHEILVYMHNNMTEIVRSKHMLMFPTDVPEKH